MLGLIILGVLIITALVPLGLILLSDTMAMGEDRRSRVHYQLVVKIVNFINTFLK
jgi:hypothetical protein